MDLEHRVTQLEQEVQMLKSQIQTTLLDIQEQVLSNAYPSLRAETSHGDKAEQGMPPVRTVSALPNEAASNNYEQDTEPETLKVRKVSLNDLQPAEPQAAQIPVYPKKVAEPVPVRPQSANGHNGTGSAKSKKAPRQLNATDIARLEEWATRKVKKHGVAATRQLIQAYVENGRIPAYVEPRLMSYVNDLSSAHADQRVQRAPKQAAQNESKPPRRPSPPPQQSRELPDFMADQEEEKTSMVLRLIAGVQNASAGVMWRK